MPEGWIKLHRKITEWEWYGDVNAYRVFTHLLMMANHKNGKWRGMAIKRGQRITSYQHLAIETSLSVQQTRTALDKLKSTGEITSHSTNEYTVLTVVNYSQYQPTNKPSNKRITNEQQTNNKRITTNKKEKNVKNEKKRKSTINSINNAEVFKEVAERYSVPVSFVESKYEDLLNYVESTGKVYKDYLATLRNWVKRDAEKVRKEQYNATRKNRVARFN